MKRFYVFIAVAMVFVLAAAMSATGLNTSAKTVEVSHDVIFISDNAVEGGDGSSSSSPLYPEAVHADKIGETTNSSGVTSGKYYLKTALYQAAQKLVDTGGTIVICGPVDIGADESYGSGSSNRDFFFPTSDKGLCITSVYDGVDYAETNGAYLGIASPAQVTLDAPTLFENITIKTTGTNRVLCANGNKLVMGEGITCESTDADPLGSNYLSVAGGSRYRSLTADTDITIKSGYYNFICGSIWGLDVSGTTYTQNGNVNITIEGGTTRGAVCGGSVSASATSLNGDVTISIYPEARIGVPVYASGQARFANAGHEVTINIYGGAYYDSSAKVNEYYTFKSSAGTDLNYPADKYTLNISNASLTARDTGSTASKLRNIFVTSAEDAGFDEILYPSVWVTDIDVVKYPSTEFVFENDTLTASGAELNVSYLNKYDNTTTYQRTVCYDPADTAFISSYNSGGIGKMTSTFRYGSKLYYSSTVEVVEVPEVAILGARIKTAGDTQGLRFVAQLTNTTDSEMTVEEYGVLSIRADLMDDSELLNFDQTYGMNIITPKSSDVVQTIGNRIIYSCTLTGIPQNRFNIDQIARAYVKLSYNGETYYRYSDIIRRNPYDIAQQAIADGSGETDAVKEYLNTSVIDVHDNYSVENVYADSTKLRNKVVTYMEAQMSMQWTPSESFWINNPKDASGVTTNLYFEAGKTYYGIPYTNSRFSQQETFSELINDGVLDLSEIPGVTACGNTTDDEATALENYKKFPGSDCSTAVITAWNTVLNGRIKLKTLTSTKYMVPGNDCGVIPVGDYEYDYDTYANNTFNMTGDSANAEKIYAAYSLLKPGDAIVHYNAENGAGHTRLVVSVDTTAKTVTTIECANWSIPSCKVTSGNGTSVSVSNNNTSWKKLTYTFDYILSDGYVPITIPELATGNSDSEYTFVTGMDLESDLPDGKLTGVAVSNRQMISVDITVSDGTNVQTLSHQPSDTNKYSAVHASKIDLTQVDMSSIELESGKTYYFSLSIRVSGLSSTTPAVKLITDYEFTAK